MKQMTLPYQTTNLSSGAKRKLRKWCKKKGYGIEIDTGFVPVTQLTIGQLLEFLLDHRVIFQVTTNKNICDDLWNIVRDILEQKN